MPTIKVTTGDFNISSSWKCKKTFVYHGTQSYGYYQYSFASGPSVGSRSVHFDFNLPSGAKVKKAQVCGKVIYGWTGYSISTANGNPFKSTSNGEYSADITLSGNNGVDVKVVFKANGSIVRDEDMHYSTTQYKEMYLLVEYEGGSSGEGNKTPVKDNSGVFSVPPQSVAIYNQENGKLYMFDGVTKIQHTFSVKIEEEPDKHKDEYVNNARNQPDKLVLDALMSDVYSDSSNMTIASGWDDNAQGSAYEKAKGSIIAMQESDGSWSRSGNAVYVLRRLKEARTKLSVITPQYVHIDMILASITINQDDTCPFGWQGQIEFQHTFKPVPQKNTNNSNKGGGKTPPPSGSVSSDVLGNSNNTTNNSGTSGGTSGNTTKSSWMSGVQNFVAKLVKGV